MLIKWFILLGFPFIYLAANGQVPSKSDSLKTILGRAQTNEERLKITLDLYDLASNSNFPLALEYANKSVQLATLIKSDSLLNIAFLDQGTAYLRLGNYAHALQLCQKVMQSAQKASNPLLFSIACKNIGTIYFAQYDYKNSLKYSLKAIEYFNSLRPGADRKLLMLKADLLNNIGGCYNEIKKKEEAAHYFKEALILARQLNDDPLVARVLHNYGGFYYDLGNRDLALKYYLEAFEVRRKNNDQPGLVKSYRSLGMVYFFKQDLNKAEFYLKNSISLGKEIGSWNVVSQASLLLSKVYKQQGDYKKGFEAIELYTDVKDSLFNIESTSKIAQLGMQFEFDRKQDLERVKEREKELYFWMGASGLCLLLIIVTLLFYLQRLKTRKSQLEKKELAYDLTTKDSDLATNIVHLVSKNELINNVLEKLLEIKQLVNVGEEAKEIVQKVVLDLRSNLQPELWQEFEYRFQQVHGQFYKVLNERFPNLTTSERRLCVFLKLGMSTKEISAVTHQNVKSIEVARSRLRKKLDLTGRDENLVNFLVQIDN